MTREALRWDAVDAGGWHYLVGLSPAARVLCYDPGAGAVALLLAGLCHEVVVLHPDSARRRLIEDQASVLGLNNIRVLDPTALRPGTGRMNDFDGFILHDPQALFLNHDHDAALNAFLQTLRRTLRPGAFVYFGVRHRYGYDRLLGWLRARHKNTLCAPLWSASALARLLRSFGFNGVSRAPMLLDQRRVTEIIPARGYFSAKNRFLPAERLKEIVLGRVGARWAAPFYGVVGFHQGVGSSFLEQLLEYFCTHAIDGIDHPALLTLKRYFVLNGGKVVLSFGAPAAAHGSIIVVLTQDAESARRRELEGEVLNALAHLPAFLSARIPKPLHAMTFLGTRCFVLSELPGVTVDAPTARLGRITGNAARVLADLHLATQQPCRMTPGTYPALFGDLFNAARERYPVFVAELNSLETALRQVVMGWEFACVRFHGDYKVENVMVDAISDEVTGIIDWELSRAAGPPLLDLIYLLVYNRVIGGSDWYSAYRAVALQARRDPSEQAIWEGYLQRVPIAAGRIPVLCVLFAIHHIGCRLQIDLSRADRKQEMHDMIQLLVSVVQNQGGSAAHSEQG